ncbi:MAG: hypothetical protein IAF38_22500 [Bacteroidia bacterium]|nr:hypothetical protein [Bacteroidia bacterium]
MVLYNPKDWIKLIFQFGKGDTIRQLWPALIGMGIYTGLLAWVEIEFIDSKIQDPTKVHSLIGFVLSMLLVFRINSAYDRWYEGRKLWGNFVNNSRNLALQLNALIPAENSELKNKMRILIGNYMIATKQHLRGYFNADELEPCENFDTEKLAQATHKPNYIAAVLYKEIIELERKKTIDSNLFLMLNEEVKSFTETTGSCERIKNTPIPYSYSLFLKKIIFLFVFTLPIGYVITFNYWAIPISILIFYVFASIELISEEIEDPFGTDTNDLPLEEICQTIKTNLKSILA